MSIVCGGMGEAGAAAAACASAGWARSVATPTVPSPANILVESFICPPCILESGLVGLAGADAHHLSDVEHEDLAVADRARVGGCCTASTTRGARSALHATSTLILGTMFVLYSHRDRFRSWPFWRPKPLTSVTVMPWTPSADKASRTSSSLNGLMMAITSFIPTSLLIPRCCIAKSVQWEDRGKVRRKTWRDRLQVRQTLCTAYFLGQC